MNYTPIIPAQLAKMYNCRFRLAERFAEPLNAAMQANAIDTPARQAAFLAQVGHESGRLRYVRELWDPAKCPWQGRYEGRVDLGNTQPGDGSKFRGRGLIQVTGRANYQACALALRLPLLNHPELLEEPQHAAASAAWFWASHGLNHLADIGDFEKITRKINGGLNGFEDRKKLWEIIKKVIY